VFFGVSFSNSALETEEKKSVSFIFSKFQLGSRIYRGRGGTQALGGESGLTTTCGCLFGFVCKKQEKAHIAGEI
jgi:hypothetical protein